MSIKNDKKNKDVMRLKEASGAKKAPCDQISTRSTGYRSCCGRLVCGEPIPNLLKGSPFRIRYYG